MKFYGALACILLILAVTPAYAQSGDELFSQADAALSGNDAAKAAELYSQAIRSGRLDKPKLSQAFLQRGRAYQATGSHARAVADFTNALWLESLSSNDQARAHGWRATSRQALGQSGLAKADLTKAKSLNPQFTAAPAPTSTTVAAARAPATGQNSGSEQSDGLLDRLISGSPSQPERVPAAAAPRRQAAPARTVQRQPETAESEDSGVLGGLGDLGSGLLSGWFGGEEESQPSQAASPAANTNSGVTVRRLEPAGPARGVRSAPAPRQTASQPSLLSRILPAAEPAPTAVAAPTRAAPAPSGASVPRAKPASTAGSSGQAGPVRLVNTEASPAAQGSPQPSATASRPSLVESILGGSSDTVAVTPPVTPETITYSDSRVASAPPWTLGADNPSSREERAALPAIPAKPKPVRVARAAPAVRTVPAVQAAPARRATPAVQAAPTAQAAPSASAESSEPLISLGNILTPAPAARPERGSARKGSWTNSTNRRRPRREAAPVWVAAPERAPAAAPQPVQVAAATPAPAARIVPAPTRGTPAQPSRATANAVLDWNEATTVGTVPARAATPASAVVASPGARTIPAPNRGAVSPAARTIPAPSRPQRTAALQVAPQARPQSAPQAAPVQRNVAALDWDAATEIRAAPVAAPVPPVVQPRVPQPQRGAGRTASNSRFVAVPAPARQAPARQVVASVPPAPPPAMATTGGQQSLGSSVPSRVFEVASQAFSGNIEPRAARRVAAEKRRAARAARRAPISRTPVPSPAPARSTASSSPATSGSGNYAVQVMAQRTKAEAEASAASITRRHGDVLAGARPFITRADIPGKGTYYRVRVGPFTGNQSANTVCQKLKGRGTDCFAVRL